MGFPGPDPNLHLALCHKWVDGMDWILLRQIVLLEHLRCYQVGLGQTPPLVWEKFPLNPVYFSEGVNTKHRHRQNVTCHHFSDYHDVHH